MKRTFAGRRQSLQGELQSLDDVLGAFPALAYPEEVMQYWLNNL
jgi:hypothetical protein